MVSVGEVHYDVLPDLTKFAGQVSRGLGRMRPIKVAIEADVAKLRRDLAGISKVKPIQIGVTADMAKFQSTIKQASTVRAVKIGVTADTGKLNSQVARATAAKPVKIKVEADTAKAQSRVDELVGAQSKLTKAERNVATAQRAASIATQRLAETQASAAAGSARLASAEQSAVRAANNLAAAQAKVGQRSEEARAATSRVGTGFLVAGAAIAVGLAKAVSVTADFDQAVSHVASTGQDARGSIQQLRSEAIKYGADTAFSAKEAANAQEELIKANVSVTDTINGGLKGALDLAAAGSLGVADAAGIMGTAMSQFELPGTQASHVADLLAAAAGKAQGEVGDFAEALKYVGPIAHSSGISIEETTGVLGEFANQGILGSQAGTTFRGVLLGLTAPSVAGAKTMAQYGINVRDASGQFIGMQGAAGELASKLGVLSQADRDAALARIFGRTSLVGATALYNGGAAGVAKWTNAVNDSGFAARTAATKMDNLRGDVEKLGGSLQSAFINGAESSQGPLRNLVQGITGVTDALGNLSPGKSSALFLGAGIAASAAIGIGGLIKLKGAVVAVKDTMQVLNLSARGVGLAAGGIGLAVGVAAAVLGHYAVASAQAKDRQDELTQAIISSNGALDDNVKKIQVTALQNSGAFDAAKKLGISYGDVTAAALGNADAQDRVNNELAKYQNTGQGANAAQAGFVASTDRGTIATQEQADAAKILGAQIGQTGTDLGIAQEKAKQYAEGLAAAKREAAGAAVTAVDHAKALQVQYTSAGAAASALGNLSGSANVYSSSMGRLAAGYRLTAKEHQTFVQGLFAEGNAYQSAESAHSGYEGSVDSAAKALGRHSLSISKDTGFLADNTDKQRAAASAIGEVASQGKAYVTSLAQQGASGERLAAATRKVRDAFIAQAHAAGLPISQARKLADSYGLIPKEVSTSFNNFGIAAAEVQVQRFRVAISKLSEPQQIKLQTIIDTKGNAAGLRYLNSISKPRQAPVKVTDNGTAANVAAAINRAAAARRHANIGVTATGTKPTAASINQVAHAKRTALIYVNQKGQQLTQRQINKTKGKGVYIAVDQKGQPLTQRKINSTKGVARYVLVNQKGQPATQSKINSTHGKDVKVGVTASGVGSTQSAINGIHGKNVVIHVTRKGFKGAPGKVGVMAEGGFVPKFAGGGIIPGTGGPRQDNVAGFDRATGVQTSWVSSQELVLPVTSRKTYGDKFLDDVRTGKFPVALAKGGTPDASSHQGRRDGGRQIVINVDLGPELGGIRRIVADEIDQYGEYQASIGRMN